MATYNATWTNADSITVTGGYATTSGSTGYTIPAYGMTEPVAMDSSIFKFREVNTMSVKAGRAQVFSGSEIVWESKKAYKSSEKAYKKANDKINSSIDKLFNK